MAVHLMLSTASSAASAASLSTPSTPALAVAETARLGRPRPPPPPAPVPRRAAAGPPASRPRPDAPATRTGPPGRRTRPRAVAPAAEAVAHESIACRPVARAASPRTPSTTRTPARTTRRVSVGARAATTAPQDARGGGDAVRTSTAYESSRCVARASRAGTRPPLRRRRTRLVRSAAGRVHGRERVRAGPDARSNRHGPPIVDFRPSRSDGYPTDGKRWTSLAARSRRDSTSRGATRPRDENQ